MGPKPPIYRKMGPKPPIYRKMTKFIEKIDKMGQKRSKMGVKNPNSAPGPLSPLFYPKTINYTPQKCQKSIKTRNLSKKSTFWTQNKIEILRETCFREKHPKLSKKWQKIDKFDPYKTKKSINLRQNFAKNVKISKIDKIMHHQKKGSITPKWTKNGVQKHRFRGILALFSIQPLFKHGSNYVQNVKSTHPKKGGSKTIDFIDSKNEKKVKKSEKKCKISTQKSAQKKSRKKTPFFRGGQKWPGTPQKLGLFGPKKGTFSTPPFFRKSHFFAPKNTQKMAKKSINLSKKTQKNGKKWKKMSYKSPKNVKKPKN